MFKEVQEATPYFSPPAGSILIPTFNSQLLLQGVAMLKEVQEAAALAVAQQTISLLRLNFLLLLQGVAMLKEVQEAAALAVAQQRLQPDAAMEVAQSFAHRLTSYTYLTPTLPAPAATPNMPTQEP